MTKIMVIGRLLIIVFITISLTGCKDDKKQKALAEEAAQARAEVIKLKAETVQLKSEVSYLNEKLATANQARDNIQKKLDLLIEDANAVTTDAQDLEQENIKLRKLLAEQLKKNGESEKQMENLKAVIRELQTRIEQQKPAEPPKQTEEASDGNQQSSQPLLSLPAM